MTGSTIYDGTWLTSLGTSMVSESDRSPEMVTSSCLNRGTSGVSSAFLVTGSCTMRSSRFPLDFMFGMVISAGHEMRSPPTGSPPTSRQTPVIVGVCLVKYYGYPVVSFRLKGRKIVLANE